MKANRANWYEYDYETDDYVRMDKVVFEELDACNQLKDSAEDEGMKNEWQKSIDDCMWAIKHFKLKRKNIGVI